jgi:hypothetical protein
MAPFGTSSYTSIGVWRTTLSGRRLGSMSRLVVRKTRFLHVANGTCTTLRLWTTFGKSTLQHCRISQLPSHVFSRSTPGRLTDYLEPNGAFSNWRAATGLLYRPHSGTCMTVRPSTTLPTPHWQDWLKSCRALHLPWRRDKPRRTNVRRVCLRGRLISSSPRSRSSAHRTLQVWRWRDRVAEHSSAPAARIPRHRTPRSPTGDMRSRNG